MENRNHFGALTERMQAFREEVLDEKPYVDAERAILATEAYKESLNQPRVMARALMLKNILEKMTIYLEDKSLLAGNQATKNRNAPVFPEYTLEFVLKELDLFEKRDGDVFYITEEAKEQIRSIAPFWENNNLRARGEALLPEEVSVFMETGVFGMEGKLNAGDAHLAVNYERLLAVGLKGYEEKTRKCKADLDLTDPDSIDKNVFYNAVLIVIEAVRAFAQRYSALAKELAENPVIGSYAGIVVSAMFGCTLVFTIPVGMGMIRGEDRNFFARGIMIGLATMPVGLLVGGLLTGLSFLNCLWQNIPVFIASFLLLIGLWKIPQKMVKGFCILADGIRILVTIGLILAAVESFCGWNPIPGMAPIEDAMAVVSSIGVVLLGSLPAAEGLRRLLAKPFTHLGAKLGVKPQSLTGMLVGLVSAIPVFSMFQEMDSRGKVAVGACLVSGTSLLAAHMGFVISTEPTMLSALFLAA